jgi:hypothetical protein
MQLNSKDEMSIEKFLYCIQKLSLTFLSIEAMENGTHNQQSLRKLKRLFIENKKRTCPNSAISKLINVVVELMGESINLFFASSAHCSC